MRWFKAVLVIVLIPLTAIAQIGDAPNVIFPRLMERASTIAGFVPKGWQLERKRIRDLNGDHRPDAVLVLHQNDPRNVLDDPSDPIHPLDTNPRMLVVMLARANGGYKRVSQNHRLIPRYNSPFNDDPFDDVALTGNTFRVITHYWASAGSWETWTTLFTFRYQNGCVGLIGYDRNNFQRNSGESNGISVNYLTGKIKKTTDDPQTGDTAVQWSSLSNNRKLCLETLGDGWAFDPEIIQK